MLLHSYRWMTQPHTRPSPLVAALAATAAFTAPYLLFAADSGLQRIVFH